MILGQPWWYWLLFLLAAFALCAAAVLIYFGTVAGAREDEAYETWKKTGRWTW